MSKNDFLNFPIDNYCSTILSLGKPGSGKTYILLKCIKWWLDHNVFKEYHCVLPAFLDEMNDSYKWLEQYPNVHIYTKYFPQIPEKIIKMQRKQNELFKKGTIKERPKIFFCIDDATSQSEKLFNDPMLLTVFTQNRHVNMHTWFLMHYNKTIIPPKVRQNIAFIFIYKLRVASLEMIHKEMVDNDDLEDFDQFRLVLKKYVYINKYGCLLLSEDEFNPYVYYWFQDEGKEKTEKKEILEKKNITISNNGNRNGKIKEEEE